MPFGRLTSASSSILKRRHLLPLSALTAFGSSLLFMVPLAAEAAGSKFCQFGTPESDFYQLLPTCSSRTPLILGDKRLTLNAPAGASAATASLYQLPTIGSGAIKFAWQEFGSGDGYLNDIWSVSVDFDPDVYAPPTTSGTFKYTLEVIDPNWVFATVDLDSVKTETQGQVGGKVEVSKLLPEGTIFPDAPLVSIDGSNVNPVAFGGEYTSIAVTDTYELTGGSSGFIILDNFQNNFTQQRSSNIPPDESAVPGPLPLLGAGAAFSFSRRLRSRLLAARWN
jgi:hypothetical protein